MNNKDLIKTAETILLEEYEFVKRGNIFQGSIILDTGHSICEKYLLEIDLSPIKNGNLPLVKEIENKIPKIQDYHINSNGSFCFGYDLSLKEIFDEIKNDFKIFVDKHIRSFIAAAKYKDLTDEWGAKEYSHNAKYVKVEEIFELFELGSSHNKYLKQFLNILFSEKGKCYCGSSKLYKNCHRRSNERLLKKISKIEVKNIIESFIKSPLDIRL